MRFEVKDGGFGYPREECIFSHVDFIMDKPEVMSVLGANGAGKTTLLKCMLGLLEWKTGGTYIDGTSIKEIPYHQLWQKIGYVPQAKASAFAYHAEDMVLLGRNAYLGTFGQPKKRTGKSPWPVWRRLESDILKAGSAAVSAEGNSRWCSLPGRWPADPPSWS